MDSLHLVAGHQFPHARGVSGDLWTANVRARVPEKGACWNSEVRHHAYGRVDHQRAYLAEFELRHEDSERIAGSHGHWAEGEQAPTKGPASAYPALGLATVQILGHARRVARKTRLIIEFHEQYRQPAEVAEENLLFDRIARGRPLMGTAYAGPGCWPRRCASRNRRPPREWLERRKTKRLSRTL